MITEWLLEISLGFAGWLAGLFPEWEDPAIFDNFASAGSTLMAGFVGLGVWVDWTVLIGCVTLQLGVMLAVVLIKLLRAVAAHIPLFGGSGD